jgi:hypothetical protein
MRHNNEDQEQRERGERKKGKEGGGELTLRLGLKVERWKELRDIFVNVSWQSLCVILTESEETKKKQEELEAYDESTHTGRTA